MIDFIIANSTIIGLIYFFSIFLYILFRVLMPSRKKELEDYAQIPLRKDINHE